MNGSSFTGEACLDSRRVMVWLLDGELAGDDAQDMHAHLDICPGCTAYWQEEQALRRMVSVARCAIVAPASLRRRVQQTMVRTRPQASMWSRAWPAALAASVLVAWVSLAPQSKQGRGWHAVARSHASNLPMDVVTSDAQKLGRYLSQRLPFAVRLPAPPSGEMRGLTAVRAGIGETGHRPASSRHRRGALVAGSAGPQDPRALGRPPIPQPAWQILGGRVVRLGNHEAAWLRLKAGQGEISVFVHEEEPSWMDERLPTMSQGAHQTVMTQRRGYTLARWASSGLVYSLVTELPQERVRPLLRYLQGP